MIERLFCIVLKSAHEITMICAVYVYGYQWTGQGELWYWIY